MDVAGCNFAAQRVTRTNAKCKFRLKCKKSGEFWEAGTLQFIYLGFLQSKTKTIPHKTACILRRIN